MSELYTGSVGIQAGAEVNAIASGGSTALMSAAANNSNVAVIQALIKAGADKKMVSIDKKTAYDHAKLSQWDDNRLEILKP